MLFESTKYTFISEACNKETLTITLRADTLQEVLESFERFLKGAGFVFSGHLDIVEEDSFDDDQHGSDEDNNIWLGDYESDDYLLSNTDLSNINISLDSDPFSNSTFQINEDNMNKSSWPFPTERI
jgi:hypothetical protein